MPLTMGETIGGLAASSLHAECLDKVLLSVQCCADTTSDCANAQVVGLGLSGQQLRGSLPEAIGNLGALTSLKVMPLSSLLLWLAFGQAHSVFALAPLKRGVCCSSTTTFW